MFQLELASPMFMFSMQRKKVLPQKAVLKLSFQQKYCFTEFVEQHIQGL